jgi:hypothetical protein
MKPWVKGLVIAVVQVGLVASLGAKLLYDRLTLPSVWVRTAPYDPNLPIRGRYVRLRLMVEARGIPDKPPGSFSGSRPPVILQVKNNQLLALADPQEHRYRPVDLHVMFIGSGEARQAVLDKPVAFFIPEHLPDPSQLKPGQELWVEVTVPPQGPPRPIRLGLKQGDGPIVHLVTE